MKNKEQLIEEHNNMIQKEIDNKYKCETAMLG